MFSRRLMRFVAAGVVAAAVAIGAYTIGDSPSANGASTPAAVAAPSPAQAPVGAPAGWRAGTGTIITGAAADKATAAAVAKYPEGTINRVLKLSDGSYAVHRIGVSTAHHIFVSKDFKVTGTS